MGISCEILHILNGGRVFVKIGDTICDPWAREVFLVTETNERLKGWKSYIADMRWYNILVEFNKNYHRIAAIPADRIVNI